MLTFMVGRDSRVEIGDGPVHLLGPLGAGCAAPGELGVDMEAALHQARSDAGAHGALCNDRNGWIHLFIPGVARASL